jgi:hypothetical protein
MFKTKKFIVFFVAVLIGITLSQAAEGKKPVKAVKAEKVSKSKVASKESVPSNYSENDDTCNCSKKSMAAVGLWSPLQFPCENTMVTGFRFSALYTYNKGVNGLDCGFICDSGSRGTIGIQAGIFANKTTGSVTGLSLSLINIAGTSLDGVQLGGLYNEVGSDSYDNAGSNYRTTSQGAQLGIGNVSNSVFEGLQMGLFNIANSVFKGCQIGFINLYDPPSDVFDDFESKEFKEMKKKRSCVQIGVLNFNPRGIFPITILVNF